MGLRKLVPVLRKGTPYNSRMFTLMRQLDWLAPVSYTHLDVYKRQELACPSCSAARLKLPLSTTATKMAISSDVALIIAPIAKFY